MKTLLLTALLLTSPLLHAQPDHAPILAPMLQAEGVLDSQSAMTVGNSGSLGGEFVIRKGDGELEITESGGKKLLKFSPTAQLSVEESLLPSLVYPQMPREFPDGVTFQARVKPDPNWMLPVCELLSARVSDRGTGMAITYQPESGLVDVVSGEGPSEDGTINTKIWGIISRAETKISAEDWTHLAAVYDSEKRQFLLYINGQLAAESESNLDLTPMNHSFTIGAYRSGYAYPFRGEMRDIAVYDYARPEAQILADAEQN